VRTMCDDEEMIRSVNVHRNVMLTNEGCCSV
jgi:hypothetical protein